jgi:membrane protein
VRRGHHPITRVLPRAIQGFLKDDCIGMSASLAFYTLFSLAPLIVIVLELTRFVADPLEVAHTLEIQAGALVGRAGADQVASIITAIQDVQASRRSASILSGILAVIGATTVLVQIQTALNRVWEIQQRPGLDLRGFLLKRIVSIAMIAILAFLLTVSLVASAVVGAASGWFAGRFPEAWSSPLTQGIDLAVSFVVFAGVFSTLFKFIPDREIAWRHVLVGGTVTSLLFSIGKAIIGKYLGQSAFASLYGAAGSLAVVLVWVFYTVILVLFGAELTKAWTVWLGDRVKAEPHAVPDSQAEGSVRS